MNAGSGTHVAMTGGGGYSLATKGAKDVIDGAWPLVETAIARIPDRPGRAFTLSDMGTADAGASFDMIGKAIDAIRGRFPERDVQVVYTDQPRNDYNAVFRRAHGLDGEPSYLDRHENVQVLASAMSFHRRILPAGTLDLGFSATAMHWLSRKPCDIEDHVHMVGASGPPLAAFRAQGAADWEAILRSRATELAPGGRLVLVTFGIDEEGRYLGSTGGVDMFDAFALIWRRMASEGRISADEHRAMTLPQHYRTMEEFRAPLDDPGNPVREAGLVLEHCESRVVPCPFAAEFARHGDAERFARDYVPTPRSWSAAAFRAALDPSRPDDERDGVVDAFFRAYEAMVREAPEGHRMDYVHVYLTVAKDGAARTVTAGSRDTSGPCT